MFFIKNLQPLPIDKRHISWRNITTLHSLPAASSWSSLKKVALFFLICMTFSAPSFASIVDGVAAKINEEIITIGEVKKRVKEIAKIRKITSPEKLKKIEFELINKMVEDKLLLLKAEEVGVTAEEPDVDLAMKDLREKNRVSEEQFEMMLRKGGYTIEKYREELRNQIIISKVVGFEVRAKINLSEKEIKKYYETHKKEFVQPEEVKASHILISKKDYTSDDEIKEAALDIYSQIKKGENFESMARLYSDDASSSDGGDLGFFKRGVMVPKFEEMAFKLKVGEVGRPVKTGFGYHIIKIAARKEAVPLSFEDAKKDIEKKLSKDQWNEKFKEVIDEIRAKNYVEIMIGQPDNETPRPGKKKNGKKRDRAGKVSKKGIADMVKKTVLKWEKSIQKEDLGRYASCYSSNFKSKQYDKKKWVKRQDKIFESNDNIEITIRGLRISKKNSLYVTTFAQEFRSDENHHLFSRRLYLRLEDGQVKIVGEKRIKQKPDFKRFSKKTRFTPKTKVQIINSSS